MTDHHPPIIMEEVTDPVELAKAQWERCDRNTAWLQAHASEIYTHYRGKCIYIAGEQLFVADTPEEVLVLAKVAHPEDNGFFSITPPVRRWPASMQINGEWRLASSVVLARVQPQGSRTTLGAPQEP